MALFSSKKNKKEITASTKPTKKDKVLAKTDSTPVTFYDVSHDLASMIVRPRVTEKSTMSAENGIYVFEVSQDSTKNKISSAISQMYKVTPKKVRIVNLPAKSVIVRGKRGEKSGVKKAYVYLKAGDKIEII